MEAMETPAQAPVNVSDWRIDHSHPLGWGHVMVWGGADGAEWTLVYAATQAEAEQKAAVITAAPKLLAALKALRDLSDANQPRKFDTAMAWIENDRIVRAMVDAAIATAEGR